MQADERVPREVLEYLEAITPSQREVVVPVFDTVRAAMPVGYEAGIHFGMPGWVVPLERYPDTYNGKPLSYVSVAAGKRYNSLYLSLYSDPVLDAEFRDKWEKTGRALDMGKSCLRYRKLADVDLDLVAEAVSAFSVDEFIAVYEQSRN